MLFPASCSAVQLPSAPLKTHLTHLWVCVREMGWMPIWGQAFISAVPCQILRVELCRETSGETSDPAMITLK